MKNKKIFSIILYSFSILFLLIYLLMELNDRIFMSEFGRLFLLCGSCVFLYFGALLLSKYRKDNKPMKISLWIFFILYCILLITLTLFDPMWGRNGLEIPKWTIDNFMIYLENSCNIIPFRTIFNYISEFDSLYSTKQILLNLLGNVFAFVPMAFFLPLLFEKTKKIKKFTITMLIIIFGIEVFQLITTSGRFDIDDFILNLFGALFGYMVLKTKSINKLIRNIFLLEKNKISKTEYAKIGILITICLVPIFLLIVYRNNLYNQNLEDFNNIHNPNIVFEYEDNCSNNNLFYEDEIYKYYFECYDANKFYAIVNDKEKLSIQKLCNDSEYLVNINRILSMFDYNKIKYKIEHKYTFFNLNIPNEKNFSYTFDKYIDNDVAKLIVMDKTNGDKNIELEVNVIPKKIGKHTFNIILSKYNDNGELVDKINNEVNIEVKKDFVVEYSR